MKTINKLLAESNYKYHELTSVVKNMVVKETKEQGIITKRVIIVPTDEAIEAGYEVSTAKNRSVLTPIKTDYIFNKDLGHKSNDSFHHTYSQPNLLVLQPGSHFSNVGLKAKQLAMIGVLEKIGIKLNKKAIDLILNNKGGLIFKILDNEFLASAKAMLAKKGLLDSTFDTKENSEILKEEIAIKKAKVKEEQEEIKKKIKLLQEQEKISLEKEQNLLKNEQDLSKFIEEASKEVTYKKNEKGLSDMVADYINGALDSKVQEKGAQEVLKAMSNYRQEGNKNVYKLASMIVNIKDTSLVKAVRDLFKIEKSSGLKEKVSAPLKKYYGIDLDGQSFIEYTNEFDLADKGHCCK
jgi:hypothetical protein